MPCDDHAGPAGAASELSAVRDELLAREPLFHRRDLGTTREAYLALTAEDFWEVGASGQVYEREWVIDTVLKRGRVVGEEA